MLGGKGRSSQADIPAGGGVGFLTSEILDQGRAFGHIGFWSHGYKGAQ